MSHPILHERSSNSRGFSLLEVLISIVILSFGLLGMVGMQAAALKANKEARIQSVATVLARELAEMMRGNKDIRLLTSNNPYLGNFTSTPTLSYCLGVGNTACANTTAIAQAQITEWLARVNEQLPGARVTVCYDASPFDSNGVPEWACTDSGNTIAIKIGWTQGSTNTGLTGSSALEKATTPSVVVPLSLGSAT